MHKRRQFILNFRLFWLYKGVRKEQVRVVENLKITIYSNENCRVFFRDEKVTKYDPWYNMVLSVTVDAQNKAS